jgi:predicted secreted protein
MGLTIVALVLFIAMIACWVVLPGSTRTTRETYEAEPGVQPTMQRAV